MKRSLRPISLSHAAARPKCRLSLSRVSAPPQSAEGAFAGGRPGKERAARHERSSDWGRGAAGSPDPYHVTEPRSVAHHEPRSVSRDEPRSVYLTSSPRTTRSGVFVTWFQVPSKALPDGTPVELWGV